MPDLEYVIDGKPLLFELDEALQGDLAEGVAYFGKRSHKKMEALSRGDTETGNSIKTARSFIPREGVAGKNSSALKE